MDYDFLIVGAGIGGAVLANLLARAGRRVLILERDPTPPSRPRPEGLWPATASFLQSLLPAEGGEAALAPLQGLTFHYRGRKIATISSDFFARVGIQLWSSNGDRTRALLLQQASCEVRRGVEVVGLLKDGNRVRGVRARPTDGGAGAEFDVAARWTVGDDGGHSIVRRECGIAMDVRFAPMEALSFGLDWPLSLPAGTAHIWINPRRTRSGLPLLGVIWRPSGLAAGLIPVRPRVFEREGAVQEALDQFAAADSEVAAFLAPRRFPADLAHLRLAWGHAASYGIAGAVLIGDAAHVVTPAGGQGANAAIADARALAEIALSDESQLLAAYERRRRPANERSMAPSRIFSRVLSLPDIVLFPWVPVLLRLPTWFPSLALRGLRYLSTAFLDEPPAGTSLNSTSQKL